jgi:hypothetical protein
MSSIYSIVTTQGQAALASAAANGTGIVLTNFKIGNAVNPVMSPTDTEIQSPQYTGTFMGPMIQPINSYLSTIECVIPSIVAIPSPGITQVGVYFTQTVGGVSSLVLFAETTYPPTPKSVGSNYIIELVIQTSASSSKEISLTVPNNQFATTQYVDIAKKAGLNDIVNPLINDNVYITPYWLQEYNTNYGSVRASTALSSSFTTDLTDALDNTIIRVGDSSVQTLNNQRYQLVDGDLIYKSADPGSGSITYTLLQPSNTLYLTSSTNITLPLQYCSNGIITSVQNSGSSTINVSLDPSLQFTNGASSVQLSSMQLLSFTRVNNTNQVVVLNVFSQTIIVPINGLVNDQIAYMADIDASNQTITPDAISNCPPATMMVVYVPGSQTINYPSGSQMVNLNIGDIVLKDASGFLSVHKAWYTNFVSTGGSGGVYSVPQSYLSSGVLTSITNTGASNILVTLPSGFIFSSYNDPLNQSIRSLRPNGTLTITFNTNTSNQVTVVSESIEINYNSIVAASNTLVSGAPCQACLQAYSTSIDASSGAFYATITNLPNGTLMVINTDSLSNQTVPGYGSIALYAGNLIYKDNVGDYWYYNFNNTSSTTTFVNTSGNIGLSQFYTNVNQNIGNITLTLPLRVNAGVGSIYSIKTSQGFGVVVAASGGDFIDYATTSIVLAPFEFASFRNSGQTWDRIN